MSTAYFYLTDEGKALVHKLCQAHPGEIYGKENFKNQLQDAFGRYDFLVCVMAAGIVVRILAPLITHKTSDPGVVVLDQKGRYAISLLSGHLGGANDLAREMAAISGGQAVITTATDVAGELSFDSFAKEHNLAIENIGQLKYISSSLLAGDQVQVITDYDWPELGRAADQGKLRIMPASVYIGSRETVKSNSSHANQAQAAAGQAPAYIPAFPTVVIHEGLILENPPAPVLYLRPRTICAGIGCKRNMDGASIKEALTTVLARENISPLSLKCISTIPLKADEPGIIQTADYLDLPLTIIPREDIESLDIEDLGIKTSSFVAEQTGVLSVSTASSYLAAGRGTILVDKAKFKGITIALSKCDRPD